jgi:anti-anti-sigma regulatory factor
MNETPDGMVMSLRGVIDEDTTFTAIDILHNPNLIFDLSGVSLINSMGIRNWVNWFKANHAKRMTFRNCSKPIVDQINALEGFLPQGSIVESFYVPYHCENCGHNDRTLFRKNHEFKMGTADAKPSVHPPEMKCSKCSKVMEMDVIEAKYFKFLKYR